MIKGRYDSVYRKLAYKLTLCLGKANNDFLKIKEELSIFVIDNLIESSQGTGFLLKGVGLVTNQHVVESIDKSNESCLEVYKYDSTSDYYKVFFIFSNKVRDVALLQPSKKFSSYPEFEVGNDRYLSVGDEVSVIGFPSFSKGSIPYKNHGKIVSSRLIFQQTVWIVDFPINHGCSGAPILNKKGQVVGIATFGKEKDDGSTEFNGFIPISSLLQMLSKENALLKEHATAYYEWSMNLISKKPNAKASKSTYLIEGRNCCSHCIDVNNKLSFVVETRDGMFVNCKMCQKIYLL